MKDNDAKKMIEHNRLVYNTIAWDFVNKRSLCCEEWRFLFDYVKPRDRVLDVGCGFGRLYNILKKKQAEYVGVDQSEEQIKMAKQMFPDAGFVVAEMSSLPFSEHHFDVIFCLRTFHHIPTAEFRLMILEEMKRVLKKGGAIVMMNWNLYSEWGKKKFSYNRPDKDGDIMVPWKNNEGKVLGERYYHGFTIDELSNLLKKAGLDVREEFYVRRNVKCGIENGEDLVTIANY